MRKWQPMFVKSIEVLSHHVKSGFIFQLRHHYSGHPLSASRVAGTSDLAATRMHPKPETALGLSREKASPGHLSHPEDPKHTHSPSLCLPVLPCVCWLHIQGPLSSGILRSGPHQKETYIGDKITTTAA